MAYRVASELGSGYEAVPTLSALAWSGDLRQLKLFGYRSGVLRPPDRHHACYDGFLGGQEAEKNQAQAPGYSVYTREIVKVRCSHCGSLNIETSTRCTNCGASF